MIWFKHPTNSASQDQLVGAVLDKFGIEGYARLYLLIEAIASQMKVKEDDPTATYSELKWCAHLHCKRKVLRKFLEDLRKIEAISYEENENGIRVRFDKVLDLLDNRATSSRLRVSSGLPRTEQSREKSREEQQEKIPADEVEDQFSWMTDALKGSNVKMELPVLALNHWIKNGVDKKQIPQLIGYVRKQFATTEKAQRHGEVVVSELRKAYAPYFAYSTVPKVMKRSVPSDFFNLAFSELHLPLDKDKKFIEAFDRCKSKTMNSSDIVYIKAKMKLVKKFTPPWVKERQNLMVKTMRGEKWS